jgi:zinc transporter ZupT
MEHRAENKAIMQRIACTMIAGALIVVGCLVALLLGGALSPERLPPMLAFYAACGAGVSLVLGLAMLERRGARHGVTAPERH